MRGKAPREGQAAKFDFSAFFRLNHLFFGRFCDKIMVMEQTRSTVSEIKFSP